MAARILTICFGLSAGASAWTQPFLPDPPGEPEVFSIDAERREALQAPGDAVERGIFVMTFGGQEIGRETFVISQSQAGWHVRSWVEPGGAGAPLRVAINYDLDLGFHSAEWETYGENRREARYGVSEDESTIIIYARYNGKTVAPQQIRIPEGAWVVSGPALSGDFGILATQSLQPGQSRSLTLLTFGTGGSERITRSSYRLTRKENRGDEASQRYAFDQSAGGMSLNGEIVADELGAPLEVTLQIEGRKVVATRAGFEAESDENEDSE